MFGTPKSEQDTEPIPPELVPKQPVEQPVQPLEKQKVEQPSPLPTAPPLEHGATVDEPQEKPEVYLARVQEKINKLAEEFAAGSINQAQFQELFDHYRREQQAVKRWIEMAPDSDAWKEATTEGKSVIIRAGHQAKALGYAIYENESGMPLNTIGQFELVIERLAQPTEPSVAPAWAAAAASRGPRRGPRPPAGAATRQTWDFASFPA